MGELSYARELYYRSSARTPPLRVVLALLVTSAAAALIGALYAVVAYFIPNLHDMILVTGAAVVALVGFAFLIAGVTTGLLRWTRVVTTAPTYWLSLCSAGAAWYGSWAAWEYLILHRAGFSVPLVKLAIPTNVCLLARSINSEGTLAFGSPRKPINGVLLWIIWTIEAAVIWFVAAWFPPRWLRGLALCHACGRWCNYREGFLSIGDGDPREVRAALENKDLAAVEALGPADMGGPRRIRLDLQSCAKCDRSHLLSAFVLRRSVDRRSGIPSYKARRFVDRLWLDAEQAGELREIKNRLWPPIAEVAQIDDEEGEESPPEPEGEGEAPAEPTGG